MNNQYHSIYEVHNGTIYGAQVRYDELNDALNALKELKCTASCGEAEEALEVLISDVKDELFKVADLLHSQRAAAEVAYVRSLREGLGL